MSENKPTRNMKYNTMTPAEAKKYRYINANCGSLGRSSVATPVRTASVSRKPRAPPLIVDHTTLNGTSSAQVDSFHFVAPPVQKRYLVQKPRCESPSRGFRRPSCENDSASTSRWSTLSHRSINSNKNHEEISRIVNHANQTQDQGQSSTDSSLNLSFRSTVEYMTDSEALHQQQSSTNGSKTTRTTLPLHTNFDFSLDKMSESEDADETLRENMNTSSDTVLMRQHSTKDISEESFTSAWYDCQSFSDNHKSHQDVHNPPPKTPENSVKNRLQSHLSSIKKFFRNPFLKVISNKSISPSRLRASSTSLKNTRLNLNGYSDKLSQPKSSAQQLAYSASKLSLNRSLTPPICPPPLSTELKSMNYLSSYSNYDEFTRRRNEQNASLLDRSVRLRGREISSIDAVDNGDIKRTQCDVTPWQLNSLPVSCERNLAPVPEDKVHQLTVTNDVCYGHPKQNWQYQTFGPRSTQAAIRPQPFNSWLNQSSIRTYTPDVTPNCAPYKKTAEIIVKNETLKSQQNITNCQETLDQTKTFQPNNQDSFLRSFNKSDCDSLSWQLNSLPLSYERNLAPVPEDFSDNHTGNDNSIAVLNNNNNHSGYLSSLLYWNRA